jgi:DNA-directed RNA polymerase subunit RPC12/RpoP
MKMLKTDAREPLRFINPRRDPLARQRRDPRWTTSSSEGPATTRYLECPACGSRIRDLYQLVTDRSRRKDGEGPVPLVCPQCKAAGLTFVAYESSGVYH